MAAPEALGQHLSPGLALKTAKSPRNAPTRTPWGDQASAVKKQRFATADQEPRTTVRSALLSSFSSRALRASGIGRLA